MSIGSGVLLPGVVEIPTFPILRPLAYTTGLGYRPTCDLLPFCSLFHNAKKKKMRSTPSLKKQQEGHLDEPDVTGTRPVKQKQVSSRLQYSVTLVEAAMFVQTWRIQHLINSNPSP